MQRAHCYLLIIGAVVRFLVSCGWICGSSFDGDFGAVFYGHVKQVDYGKSHVPLCKPLSPSHALCLCHRAAGEYWKISFTR